MPDSIKDITFDSIEQQRKEWPQKRWEDEGRPRMWCKVEEITKMAGKTYKAEVDTAYGAVRISLNDEVIGMGKWAVTTNKKDEPVVLLDRDYYGVEKYIWF